MTNEDFAQRILAMSPMLYRLCLTQLRQPAGDGLHDVLDRRITADGAW